MTESDLIWTQFSARPQRGTNFGVLGMKERVDISAARLSLLPVLGHGTCLHVHFPLTWQPDPTIVRTSSEEAPMSPIRVLFADDHVLFRAGIRCLFNA